jgi:hypothetical protein
MQFSSLDKLTLGRRDADPVSLSGDVDCPLELLEGKFRAFPIHDTGIHHDQLDHRRL